MGLKSILTIVCTKHMYISPDNICFLALLLICVFINDWHFYYIATIIDTSLYVYGAQYEMNGHLIRYEFSGHHRPSYRFFVDFVVTLVVVKTQTQQELLRQESCFKER